MGPAHPHDTPMNPKLTKAAAVEAAKSFRQRLDALLQEMKELRTALQNRNSGVAQRLAPDSMMTPEDRAAAAQARAEYEAEQFLDHGEVIANHILSMRAVEDAIMRQGMALKYVGTPDPYPHSKDPSSSIVEPNADGLKM